jgi:hypothetical protein
MRPVHLSDRMIRFSAAIALLAGCSASQEQPATPSAWQSVVRSGLSDRSWMAPSAQSSNLLYIGYYEDQTVGVFSYPEGVQVGSISGFPGSPDGLCSDVRGNVWVTIEGGWIYEYAHGGTSPIAKLPDGKLNAWACSVDPTTGNLAVASVAAPSGDYGNVAIYKHAAGLPKTYKDPQFGGYFGCGYDPSGNLYITGFSSNSSYADVFAELPKGGHRMETVTLSHTPQGDGDVQWDGQYVAVSSPYEQMIIRFRISGKLGKETGYTSFNDFSDVFQFSFPNLKARDGKMAGRVIGASEESGEMMYWDYPQGGSPTQTFGGDDGEIVGSVVSLAPK